MHISYFDSLNYDLKYATNATGAWVTETIDAVGDVGEFSSIALDSNNNVHISYGSFDFDLKYATDASDVWVTSTIDNMDRVRIYWPLLSSSIAIDSNNNVHISYCDITNYDLKYATTFVGVIKGDLNSDGMVNIFDVILCLRMALDLPVNIEGATYHPPYPLWLIGRADMNADGEVNIFDVILVLRKALGLDP